MRLGTYEIPEVRLVPNAIADVKKIYDIVKTESIGTKEIGTVFGYKQHSTGIFYRRLTSMLAYGLLSQLSRSTYKVSEVGIALCYPEPEKESLYKNKAILNVGLWNEIFKKFGKNPPLDNFWIQLKNITGIEPVEAQKMQSQIRKWYLDDISLLTLDPLGHPIMDGISPLEEKNMQVHEETKGLSSNAPNIRSVSQELVPPDSLGMLTVPDMGSILIKNEDTLAIARTYLDVLEKKLKAKEWQVVGTVQLDDKPSSNE